MSTSPDDRIVNAISQWLAGHIGDDQLREALTTEGLSGEQAMAVDELAAELSRPDRRRGQLQMVARETLEALALG
jgi:hypothetical protein